MKNEDSPTFLRSIETIQRYSPLLLSIFDL